MKLKIYQVDAFTKKIFSGNPAAVVPLERWLDDEILQSIAAENNLAETAFFVKEENSFRIRWFTPTVEVDLCGHATLASAKILFDHLNYSEPEIKFLSRSGILSVAKSGEKIILDFPTDTISREEKIPEEIFAGIGMQPIEIYKGKSDYLIVLETQGQIENIMPDFRTIASLDARGLIITAKGDDCDFVSRFFAPQSGIDEDPVTGSAHTTLTPYWAEKTEKKKFFARQLSQRGGELECELVGNRVKIGGNAVVYMIGEIFVEE